MLEEWCWAITKPYSSLSNHDGWVKSALHRLILVLGWWGRNNIFYLKSFLVVCGIARGRPRGFSQLSK